MYIVDFLLTYNATAWAECSYYIQNHAQIASINRVLSSAYQHQMTPNDEHGIIIKGLDIDLADGAEFCKAMYDYTGYMSSVSSYFHKVIYPDGMDNYRGSWGGNPFNVKIAKHFVMGSGFADVSGSIINSGGLTLGSGTKSPIASTPAKPMPPAINNHTCVQCKNTKCSKTEKQCWNCGCPIKP